MEINRLFDILKYAQTEFAHKSDYLANKADGKWVSYSASEYYAFAQNLSYGLLSLGLEKGDRVVTISNNRPEWNFMDMAILQAGMVHVPIYPTLSETDYEFILDHCKPKILVVSDKSLYQKLKPITDKLRTEVLVYTFNTVDKANNWKEILDAGKSKASDFEKRLNEIRESVKSEELATMIYTSGTTGNPKGVMLSHNNILHNVRGIQDLYDMCVEDTGLSFLPLSHIFERTINYYYQTVGVSIYYAESLGTISENLKEVKPTVFTAVPRVLERIYDKIIGVGKDLKGVKKQLFFWAVNLGLRYEFYDRNGWFYKLKMKVADKLIFSKWRLAVGGNVRLLVVGGAALQPRLTRIFNAAKIPLVEGYGMTETSPVISCNSEKAGMMVGTVGTILPGVKVMISDDGEIMVKGDSVMLGYYEDKTQTTESFDKDGWLHTGDVGELIDNKYLKITDRKKEMFKLSSGKYIAPQVIENKCKESFFIDQLMVVGENEKFASALISPNFPFLHNWCSIHGVKYRDNQELIKDQKVLARFQKEITLLNKRMGQTEHIKRFRLVHEEWSANTGELSPTLKLKRRFVYNKYKELLTEIYSGRKN